MSQTPDKSPWIVDADDQSFQSEAVERSRELLVVVDFWAEWCQPCRALSPILEQLAREYAGKFALVKVDVERAQGIAAGFGVQSIPAVYAMRDGQLLDFFAGLVPEGQVRAWIDRLLPSPAEVLVAEARNLESADPMSAESKYREAASLDPNLAAAKIALAVLLINEHRTDEAQSIIDELEERGFLEPEAEKVKSELHMAQQSNKAGDLDKLRAAVAADPKNLQVRLELAEALAAKKEFQQALDMALSVVEMHKPEFVEPAREFMVDLFRVLGEENELVGEYRRKLSTALY
jgi:putative thioredoxin